MSSTRFHEAFEVDVMLDREPDAHNVFFADMANDASEPGFDPNEEYDLDGEGELELADYSDDEWD